MNTKQSKRLKKRAAELIKALGVESFDDEYEQIKNCVSWERAENPDGSLMRDEQGGTLLRPVRNPGTIQLKNSTRLFYKFLKRLYKADKEYARIIMEGSEKELLDLFDKQQ